MDIKTAGILANPIKASAAPVAKQLVERLRAAGIRVLADPVAASMTGLQGMALEFLAAQADALIVIGGDGTILRAAAQLGQAVKPMAALNAGRLGFLTTATTDELDAVVRALASGQIQVSRRGTVECAFTSADGQQHVRTGLNEAVVSRGNISRMVRLDVTVDGEFLNAYSGDGLIISTPTGSTAYSLSAGGPIIHPEAAVLCITPICPHAVSSRACVVHNDAHIEILPSGYAAEIVLSIDGGEVYPLSPGVPVSLRRGAWTVPLIRLPGASFYSVLRTKLHWTGSSV